MTKGKPWDPFTRSAFHCSFLEEKLLYKHMAVIIVLFRLKQCALPSCYKIPSGFHSQTGSSADPWFNLLQESSHRKQTTTFTLSEVTHVQLLVAWMSKNIRAKGLIYNKTELDRAGWRRVPLYAGSQTIRINHFWNVSLFKAKRGLKKRKVWRISRMRPHVVFFFPWTDESDLIFNLIFNFEWVWDGHDQFRRR